ncbi:MAG: PIN domain-containing protein [Armatimonadetes bacterium]|nr:PIN domain-containing protein [Armatimonadota bacterium]
MSVVLDACAMLATLRGEPGAQVVRHLLRENRGACYTHSLNVCEVFYGICRERGLPTAQRAVRVLAGFGIAFREDMDQPFWEDIGLLKATNRVSLADAVCLGLARRLGAILYTSDHHEFDAIASTAGCQIRFIR